MNDWPEGADPKAAYLSFTPDMDEDKAVAVFIRKYGHPPEYIKEDDVLLRLGPIEATP